MTSMASKLLRCTNTTGILDPPSIGGYWFKNNFDGPDVNPYPNGNDDIGVPFTTLAFERISNVIHSVNVDLSHYTQNWSQYGLIPQDYQLRAKAWFPSGFHSCHINIYAHTHNLYLFGTSDASFGSKWALRGNMTGSDQELLGMSPFVASTWHSLEIKVTSLWNFVFLLNGVIMGNYSITDSTYRSRLISPTNSSSVVLGTSGGSGTSGYFDDFSISDPDIIP